MSPRPFRLAQALDIDCLGCQRPPQSGSAIGADAGVIDWFQYGGNTYVLEAINTTSTAAQYGALAACLPSTALPQAP